LQDFLLALTATLGVMLIVGMMGFGPAILEWLEDMGQAQDQAQDQA